MKLLNIFEDIEFKGNKANILLKWVVFLAVFGIVTAFVIGQLKINHLNKLDDIEKLAKEGIEKTEILDKKIDDKINEQNEKIDQIYKNGFTAFQEYREFNDKQLEIIIDYGSDNKELTKKVLELNSKKNELEIENNINESKRTKPELNPQISVKPQTKVLILMEVESGRKIYKVTDAPENYLDTLNLNKFEIISKEATNKYDDLYNFEYIKK